MAKLSIEEAKQKVKELRGWRLGKGFIEKQFRFRDFVSAVAFVNKIVPIAEDLNHHPDLTLKNYNELIVQSTTHDEGGLTTLDFELAKRIDALPL